MPTLKVFVNEATNLLGLDLDGKSDPYCVLKIGEGNQFSAIEKTRKITNTKNPTWKECFTLNVNNPLTEYLVLEVWNKESMSKDDSLGYAQISLNDLQRGVEKQVWVQLEGGATTGGGVISSIAHLGKKKEKRNEGKVFLGLTALDFGIDPSHAQQQFGQQGMQGQHQMPIGNQGLQGQHQPGMQQVPSGQQGIQGQSGIHDPSKQQSGNIGQQHVMGSQYQQQPPVGGQQFQPGMQQGNIAQQPGMQQGNIGQQPSVGSGQSYQPGMQQSSTHPPGMSNIDPSKQQQQHYAQDL